MKRRVLSDLLIAALLVFIWGNSLLSREISGYISDTVMEYMNICAEALGLGENFFSYFTDTDGDGVEEETSGIVRKAAHVTEFALLGALIWLRLESRGRRRFLTALALGVCAAATDETLQIFSHRGSQLRDVGIDSIGVLLGLGICLLLSGKKRTDRKKIE